MGKTSPFMAGMGEITLLVMFLFSDAHRGV
jgi:hypothetical protein